MPTLPSKEELKSMMYRDLQKICKDWGVRANLKSEELIDLLLKTQSKPTPAAVPSAKQRSVSTRRSSKDGLRQISSTAVQDVPDEIPQLQTREPTTSRTITDPPAVLPSGLPTRTRKAKELQKRLGVGRPVAVGGSGPRAVTRSATISREKRLRGSESMKQLEATIQEGTANNLHSQQASTSRHPRSTSGTPQVEASPSEEKEKSIVTTIAIPDYQILFAKYIKPLQDQVVSLRAEVKRLQDLETEFHRFRNSVNQLMMPRSTAQEGQTGEGLDGQGQLLQSDPSTPPPANPQVLSEPQSSVPSAQLGTPSVLLGKRTREETPIAEGDDEQEVLRSSLGPSKKRPKLWGEIPDNKGKEVARDEPTSQLESGGRSNSTTILRNSSFIVYNDTDEDQVPHSSLPINLFPYYYTSRPEDLPGSPRQGRSTSSANAPENQPFNFSFLPGPPTPTPPLFIPPLPYPEPPQSPTPTGSSLPGSLGNAAERTDVFKTFGMPPPDRAGRLPGPSSEATVDPAALSQRTPSDKMHQPSSNEIGAGLGLLPSVPSGSDASPEQEIPTAKKTMYGTELEGDTRFGDFVLGGVATGFWPGGRF